MSSLADELGAGTRQQSARGIVHFMFRPEILYTIK